MGLFVLGAGATRGCKFVDPTRDPCLPPLDTDFFTQLQRVRNPKHQELIKKVLQDVVQLFGVNFSVTMETVFATLEHTTRILKTTGDNRAYKRKELQAKRDRLVQAVAVVLEDSLTERDDQGHSSLKMLQRAHHDKLVKEILKKEDHVISFNYDCVLDYHLKRCGDQKWNARYGYGFDLGSRGHRLSGDGYWNPEQPAKNTGTLRVYKLHGSLHFHVSGGDSRPKIRLKQRPYTKQRGNLHFSIIPPEWHKAYDKGIYAKLWRDAAEAIKRTKHMVIIGYSLPSTDLHSTALFRTSVRPRSLKSLVVVNPDTEARKRCRTVVQSGLTGNTRILSFDYLRDFVAVDRKVWET